LNNVYLQWPVQQTGHFFILLIKTVSTCRKACHCPAYCFLNSFIRIFRHTETYTNPDLLVNAVSVVKNKQHVGATSGSYGYAGPFRPYGGMVTTQTTFQSYNYKDGSLMIDVVDAKARKLVWQGAVNAELTKQPKNPDEAIQKAVSRTMASFPAGANGFN
jgi:hypothetical protein